MYQSKINGVRYRMDGAEVSVINKAGSPILCGALKITDILTVEGQTYTISCGLACGDGIMLSVNRAEGVERCIMVSEVTASGYRKFDIARFVHFLMLKLSNITGCSKEHYEKNTKNNLQYILLLLSLYCCFIHYLPFV